MLNLGSAVALLAFAAYALVRASAPHRVPLAVFAASWGAASAVPNLAQMAGLEGPRANLLAAALALPVLPALVALAWRPPRPRTSTLALTALVVAVPLAPRAAAWASGGSFGLVWLAIVFTGFTAALALLAAQASMRPRDAAPRILALALVPYPAFIAGFYLYGASGAPASIPTGAYLALVLLAAMWIAAGRGGGLAVGPFAPRMIAWLLLGLPIGGALLTKVAGGVARANEVAGLPGIARLATVVTLLWAVKRLQEGSRTT